MGILIAVTISVGAGIALREAYVWLPTLSSFLLKRSVQLLDPQDRERCHEEWSASQEAMPDSTVKLFHAVSFLWGAYRINADRRAATRKAQYQKVLELASQLTAGFGTVRETKARYEGMIVKVDEIISIARDIEPLDASIVLNLQRIKTLLVRHAATFDSFRTDRMARHWSIARRLLKDLGPVGPVAASIPLAMVFREFRALSRQFSDHIVPTGEEIDKHVFPALDTVKRALADVKTTLKRPR